MKRIILLSIIALLIAVNTMASSIPGDLISSFNTGNAAGISKTQAEIILRDFFTQNPAKKFELLHEGGKEASKYAIGNLKSSTGSFRITFLLKSVNSKVFIHQLRIEKENE